MTTTILLVLVAIQLVLLIALLLRNPATRHAELERAIRDELGSARSEFSASVHQLRESNENRINALRGTLDQQLLALRASNEQKLEQMRQTVDEKLQGTLEKRLGESFKLVSDRLEAVQRGLGEMHSLAADVGGLKRVLTNVKTRGVFGEVQLGALLEDILTPDQYGRNIEIEPGSRERVEFGVRLPGGGEHDEPMWLPIDAKFPQEDYQRLLDCAQAGDEVGTRAATQALVNRVDLEARKIRDKYIKPPHSTDFAILFLPTEGLHAEILRQPGFVQDIRRRYQVVLAGPTSLSAILSSLRMGFHTLAIEKRSSEVWKILAAVKTEFGKFGEVLDKVKKQLETASNTIDETGRRTRAMERQLRDVEQLPEGEAASLLGLTARSSSGGGPAA